MSPSAYAVAFLAILACPITSQQQQPNPTVTTNSGRVLGQIAKDANGKDFYSFRSIPFAKPPVGSLRFKAPLPIEPWKDVLNATLPPPACPQFDLGSSVVEGQEDCLYLNVFTPKLPANNTALKTVMVFIHGGAFQGGSTKNEYDPVFLLTEDVVLATLQYRVGFLGFLNSKNESLEVFGNAALKDQSLALAWIKDNIRHFGGDPNAITIFGESAGAGSVHFQVLSPMSKGLFRRAIIQSGSALTKWAIGAKDNAKILAKALNISTADEAKMLLDLQKATTRSLLDAQKKLIQFDGISSQWPSSPVIETQKNKPAFIAEDPLALIRSGRHNKVDLMIGYNSQEGILVEMEAKGSTGAFVVLKELKDFEQRIPYDLRSKPDKLKEIAEKMRGQYAKLNGSLPLQQTLFFFTDTWFMYHTYQAANEHAKASKEPVYLYRFDMDTQLNFLKLSVPELAKYPGAAHADDLGYLFKRPKTPQIKPGSIEDVSIKRMIRLWANFAKYGNPTPKNESLLGVTWKPYTAGSSKIMSLANQLKSDVDIYEWERIQFWDGIYKSYA